MLHQRSFKPAKCKTALKLAVSRIKLLKNKREAYVKQLRRELAQLLQSGHDHTATIRVEHVVREEKTMVAYDLIEIYCELIAARLPMIESLKKCPIDLKEAISSVIFASPRSSDIPELMDVQKHIMAKYGKEFVSAAVQLRPDSGVNCLLVEKLSAKAPDGPTKIKILTAIAEEHSVKWQPNAFGENDAQLSQDLVAGPITFEKSTYVEPPQVNVPPLQDEKGAPNKRAFYQLKEIHDIPTNSYEHSTSVASRKASGDQSTTSGRSNPEIRSSGTGSQEMSFRDSYHENSSAFPLGRNNWNMEFKDAVSAAQAAAESAEHASMAARAAAELSNREKLARQYSSGSYGSSDSKSRGEVPQEYAFHADKHLSRGSVNNTFHRGSFGNLFANDSRMADIHPHNNSFKQENSDFLHEMSRKKQVSRTEVDFVTELHADMKTENDDHIGDAWTNRQFSKASSSHFVIPSNDHNDHLNLNGWKMGNKAVGGPFVTDEGKTLRSTTGRSSYNDTAIAFDDFGSKDGDYTFVVGKEYNRRESSLIFSSPPGSKSEVDPLSNTNAWSPGQVIDQKERSSCSLSRFPVLSETLTKTAVSSGKEDSFYDIFDDSDGPSSDSDEDFSRPVSRNFGYGNSALDQSENHGALGTSSRSGKIVGSERKSWLSPSSAGADIVGEHSERKVAITAESEKNFGHDDLPRRHASFSGRGTVSGYTRPPYTKSKSVEGSSLLEDIAVQNEQSLPNVWTSISSDAPAQGKYKREVSRGNIYLGLRAHNTSSDSNRYDVDASSQECVTSTYNPCIQKGSSKASNTYFDSNTSDSEDRLTKQKSLSLARPVSELSQTLKTGTSLKDASFPKASVTPGTRPGWKSSRASYESNNQKASTMMKRSDSWASSEDGTAEHAAYKPSSAPNRSSRVQPSSSVPEKMIPYSEVASQSLNSDGGVPSKKKPAHVHPKLPDYDSLAAYFLSLKKGRQ